MKQSPSAGVHTFCDRQKPLPDGAAQYYVAGRVLIVSGAVQGGSGDRESDRPGFNPGYRPPALM